MSGTKPTFLIVGSAKSGTTSMYHYLKNHPMVFMCPVKEPDYFGGNSWQLPLSNIHGENPDLEIFQNWDEYLSLYEGSEGFPARGEASPSTLYFYESAIPEIKDKLGNPKIIILLRNPVKRAFSHYNFLKRDDKENVSFREALELEPQRKSNNFHYGYFYQSLSFYAAAVKAFQQNFDNVYIQLYDELRARPLEVYKEICQFLEISEDYTPELEVKHNKSGTPRSGWLNKFFRGKNPIRDFMRPVVDSLLTEEQKNNFVEKVHAMNLKSNQELSVEDHEYLQQKLLSDIEELEGLLGRKLDHWK